MQSTKYKTRQGSSVPIIISFMIVLVLQVMIWPPLAPEGGAVLASTLIKPGDQGDAVEEIQNRLAALGFFPGPITGIFGDQTRFAVEKAQDAAGLSPDGIIGTETLKALDIFEGQIDEYPELKIYSHSPEVFYLQHLLKDLGYFRVQPTGLFRSLTREAVRQFQADRDLEVDGMVGESTWRALEEQSRIKEEISEERKPQEEEQVDLRKEEEISEPEEIIREEKPEKKPANPPRRPVLRTGDTGEEVRELQILLQRRGFYHSSIDGHFGYQTYLAVKQLQNLAGLQVDGVAGSQTWVELLTDADNGGEMSYTIKPGDSLWALASRFDTTVNRIKTVNGLSGDGIIAGQRIKIPGAGGLEAEVRSTHWHQVNPMMPPNSVFIITDVETGLSFKVHRLYGNRHSDVEPLSSRDTAIKHQIYGGEWSWERRAVVVHLNGMLIAGSINGMPHGGQEIYNNNYPGHFCLHFYGSTLHNNGTQDSDHQYMVRKAVETGWPLFPQK